MTIIDSINAHWFWAGVSAAHVEAQNAFGSLIVADTRGRFWRICPEELSARVIARDREELLALWQTADFTEDWSMSRLANQAITALGKPASSETFYFVIPTVLGGTYSIDNIRHIGWEQLLSHSGDLAMQVDTLPDGAQVRLIVED